VREGPHPTTALRGSTNSSRCCVNCVVRGTVATVGAQARRAAGRQRHHSPRSPSRHPTTAFPVAPTLRSSRATSRHLICASLPLLPPCAAHSCLAPHCAFALILTVLLALPDLVTRSCAATATACGGVRGAMGASGCGDERPRAGPLRAVAPAPRSDRRLQAARRFPLGQTSQHAQGTPTPLDRPPLSPHARALSSLSPSSPASSHLLLGAHTSPLPCPVARR